MVGERAGAERLPIDDKAWWLAILRHEGASRCRPLFRPLGVAAGAADIQISRDRMTKFVDLAVFDHPVVGSLPTDRLDPTPQRLTHQLLAQVQGTQ